MNKIGIEDKGRGNGVGNKRKLEKGMLDWAAVGRRIGNQITAKYGSVDRFARTLGLSSSAVYRNVNGVQKPGLNSLLLYRECLDCSLNMLLGLISPDRDSGTAWSKSISRIRTFRERWRLEDRFRIACLVSGMIPEEAELELRTETGMDSDPCGSQKRSEINE